MRPVFVQDVQPVPPGFSVPQGEARLPSDFDLESGDTTTTRARLSATSKVALSQEGPYELVADALERSIRMRERFAFGLGLRCVARWRWARFFLFLLATGPLGLLVEVDREQLAAAREGDGTLARLIVDSFLMAMALTDIAWRIPRFPVTSGLILCAAGVRFVFYIARACGKTSPVLYAVALVAIAAGVSLLALAPTRRRVVKETLSRVGISDADVRATRMAPRPSLAFVAAAVACAAGLPLMLLASQRAGLDATVQALFFAGYAALVPAAIQLFFERRLRAPRAGFLALVTIVAFAFALTHSVTDGARYCVDAGAFVVDCASPGPSSAAKRLLEAQHSEVTRTTLRDRESWALFAMSVLIVPLAEERVYRGLLQRVLAARWGRWRGIAASSIVFGLAHLGVYQAAVYQMVMLGICFGVAYVEGGIIAAALVHALWNLHLLL